MIDRIVSIMARLRHPDLGCEWDRAQTAATIAPYTIEEAHEVADAIERGDMAALKDELGDLLLQVVFHSRIAEELGAFSLADVVTAISDKMERRHPHIFGDAAASPGWEQIKASERQSGGATGTLDGVARGLPALMRAEKLQKRAAGVGFDWPDAVGPRAKVIEEIDEIDAASPDDQVEEVGDLLFAVVNWARHLGIDAESALRQASAKFERRFAVVEQAAGDRLETATLADLDVWWDLAKQRERAPER